VLAAPLRITVIKSSQMQRAPAPPFITSTLQQEASTRLGMGATATMSVAQKLYEGVDGSDGNPHTHTHTQVVVEPAGSWVSPLEPGPVVVSGFSHLTPLHAPRSPTVRAAR
jgi:reverse gyrase